MAGSKIPENWVRDEEKGPFYDVTNPREVAMLAMRILKVAEKGGEKAEVVAAVITSKGLMRTDFFTRVCVTLFKWRYGYTDSSAWQALFAHFPEAVEKLLIETSNHCQWGKDKDTPFAVCGFDQQEADYIAATLHIADGMYDA